MSRDKSVPLTFRVPLSLHHLLEAEMAKTGESVADLGRRILSAHFNQEQFFQRFSSALTGTESRILQKIDSLAIEEAA